MNLQRIPVPDDLAGLAGAGVTLLNLEAMGFAADGMALLVRSQYRVDGDTSGSHYAVWVYDIATSRYTTCLNTLMAPDAACRAATTAEHARTQPHARPPPSMQGVPYQIRCHVTAHGAHGAGCALSSGQEAARSAGARGPVPEECRRRCAERVRREARSPQMPHASRARPRRPRPRVPRHVHTDRRGCRVQSAAATLLFM